jgi:transposase
MDATTEADRLIGIDVSKARVDVHVRPDATAFHCTTDPDGLAELATRLTPLQPRLVVLEASGGFEGVVAAALAEAGMPVAIVNPRQVRKFAGAIGRLAKTDAIDAAVIAHFAQAVCPAARPMPNDLAARLAELPELGQVSRHQIAALAGVAPMNRDSGRYRGKRKIQGGRVEVRAPLYMACLVAIRHNPTLKPFYRRLREAGKPARLARVAAMRELLTILNAILRDGKPWAPAHSWASK